MVIISKPSEIQFLSMFIYQLLAKLWFFILIDFTLICHMAIFENFYIVN